MRIPVLQTSSLLKYGLATVSLGLLIGLMACNRSPRKEETVTIVEPGEPQFPQGPGVIVLPKDPGAAGKMTVAGIDSDSDGFRDDVQIHLYVNYTDLTERAAVKQLAKALQFMVVNASDSLLARSSAVSMNQAIDCLYGLDYSVFASRVEDIEGVVINTEARTAAYAKSGAYVSGASYTVSTVVDNTAACEVHP